MVPLRRTRGDLLATGVITAVSLAAVAGVWFTAPIRSSELSPAEVAHVADAPLDRVPDSLHPAWSLADAPVPGVTRPLTVAGLVVTYDDHTVTASDPRGQPVWTYRRDLELCSLGTAWDRVVTTWRAGNGCGDVVSLTASTGQYADTRSAIAPEEVVAVGSDDRVGTAGTDRVELWRSDLVRTVEYGTVEALQEPGLQPHPGCRITSALTRSELLAVTEVCGDSTWLRLQEATPESSREPEVRADVRLQDADARLVAAGQLGVAVIDGGELVSFVLEVSGTGDGENTETPEDFAATETGRRPVAPLPPVEGPLPHAPVTGDLPEHVTFLHDGRLHLLDPDTLTVVHELDGALGTGVAVGGRLLLPVSGGVAVVDWESGETEKILPVDRGNWTGPVTLGLAGATVVEKRGTEIVGLLPG